jgi:hypothetical protein
VGITTEEKIYTDIVISLIPENIKHENTFVAKNSSSKYFFIAL